VIIVLTLWLIPVMRENGVYKLEKIATWVVSRGMRTVKGRTPKCESGEDEVFWALNKN